MFDVLFEYFIWVDLSARCADENWVVMEGEWEWWIDGQGTQRVKENDIIVVPAKTRHQITCVGDKVGVRYAITKPDVTHIYG